MSSLQSRLRRPWMCVHLSCPMAWLRKTRCPWTRQHTLFEGLCSCSQTSGCMRITWWFWENVNSRSYLWKWSSGDLELAQEPALQLANSNVSQTLRITGLNFIVWRFVMNWHLWRQRRAGPLQILNFASERTVERTREAKFSWANSTPPHHY